MNILILMAGTAKDFEEKGHIYPKYLLEVQNKPIIQRITESLENVGEKITCIIRHQDQEKYFLGVVFSLKIDLVSDLGIENLSVS